MIPAEWAAALPPGRPHWRPRQASRERCPLSPPSPCCLERRRAPNGNCAVVVTHYTFVPSHLPHHFLSLFLSLLDGPCAEPHNAPSHRHTLPPSSAAHARMLGGRQRRCRHRRPPVHAPPRAIAPRRRPAPPHHHHPTPRPVVRCMWCTPPAQHRGASALPQRWGSNTRPNAPPPNPLFAPLFQFICFPAALPRSFSRLPTLFLPTHPGAPLLPRRANPAAGAPNAAACICLPACSQGARGRRCWCTSSSESRAARPGRSLKTPLLYDAQERSCGRARARARLAAARGARAPPFYPRRNPLPSLPCATPTFLSSPTHASPQFVPSSRKPPSLPPPIESHRCNPSMIFTSYSEDSEFGVCMHP